jgi:hypothetical protein
VSLLPTDSLASVVSFWDYIIIILIITVHLIYYNLDYSAFILLQQVYTMANSKSSATALNARCPVSNVFIRAAEYIRAWAAVKHLEDIDVVYLIMHKWSPDARNTFDMFVRTKAFRLGADLTRNNYVHDWNEIENSVFVSRTIQDVLVVYNEIRVELKRGRHIAPETNLIVNGREISVYGRDEGSARLLYSILAMTVSAEQIATLRDDVLGNGVVSRILLDENFKAVMSRTEDDVLFSKILRFVEFLKIYVIDEILCFAAAILLFENEFTDLDLGKFANPIPSVKNLMITELAMESVMILTHDIHPCLEKIYYLNGQFTDPWKALPDYDNIIKPFLEKPLTIEKYNESKEFSIRVNASLDAANDFWRACFKPQTEMFGANLLAATNEFSQDIVLNDVTDYCHDYMKNVSEPCKVFLYGTNDVTNFSVLGIDDSVILNVLSLNNHIPFSLRPNNRAVFHRTPESYTTSLMDYSDIAVLIYDFTDTENVTTDRATYRINSTLAPNSSMTRCFESFSSFFKKPNSRDPQTYHDSLPYMIVFRFIPYHDDGDLQTQSVLRRLNHHYVLKYVLPVDFGGLAFTIQAVKRVKMLPKIHKHNCDPPAILDAFVYHAMAVRMAFLDMVSRHLISWRMFGPLRMLSRYHGYGSHNTKFKVQENLKFAQWGINITINDYNNIFGECDAPELFHRKNTILQLNTKRRKKNQKKVGADHGVSILQKKSEVVRDFFARSIAPNYVGDRPKPPSINVKSPLFKKERQVAHSEAFPI